MRTDISTYSTPDEANVDEVSIEWLATPGRIFSHPQDVLDHPALEPSEKRIILASWASDVRAVENDPSLRQIDCGARVKLTEILAALRALDSVPQSPRWMIADLDRGAPASSGRGAREA